MKKQMWRFIYSGQNDPYFNMAVDEVLLNSVQNESPPTFRLYEWNPAAVSIGYFQEVRKTVDLNKCNRAGVKLVRRITGGRAVLHNKELTYSFCGSSENFPELGRNVSETYQKICSALLFSLKTLGIEAEWVKPKKEDGSTKKAFFNLPCFSSFSRYEISFQGKKLIGSAQRRFGGSFLQHGSILIHRGVLKLIDFLPVNSFSNKNRIDENLTYIDEIKGESVKKHEIINSLKQGFSILFQKDFKEGFLTSGELINANKLKGKKYLTEGWNLKF